MESGVYVKYFYYLRLSHAHHFVALDIPARIIARAKIIYSPFVIAASLLCSASSRPDLSGAKWFTESAAITNFNASPRTRRTLRRPY